MSVSYGGSVKKVRGLFIVALIAVVTFSGCKKKEEKRAQEMMPPHGMTGAKVEAVVLVPESVKGKWKSVKIAVTDKTTGKSTEHDVAIASKLAVPGSDLVIEVLNFLPDFSMDGNVRTSRSNDPNNPAAQIRVTEGGKEIYKNWLFAKLKSPHAFQHAKYDISLVGYTPAGK
jgi:hypothetical protein